MQMVSPADIEDSCVERLCSFDIIRQKEAERASLNDSFQTLLEKYKKAQSSPTWATCTAERNRAATDKTKFKRMEAHLADLDNFLVLARLKYGKGAHTM